MRVLGNHAQGKSSGYQPLMMFETSKKIPQQGIQNVKGFRKMKNSHSPEVFKFLKIFTRSFMKRTPRNRTEKDE